MKKLFLLLSLTACTNTTEENCGAIIPIEIKPIEPIKMKPPTVTIQLCVEYNKPRN